MSSATIVLSCLSHLAVEGILTFLLLVEDLPLEKHDEEEEGIVISNYLLLLVLVLVLLLLVFFLIS
jgi:hypothetical protein